MAPAIHFHGILDGAFIHWPLWGSLGRKVEGLFPEDFLTARLRYTVPGTVRTHT